MQQRPAPVYHAPAAISADCPWIKKVGDISSVLGGSDWAVFGTVDKVVDGIYDVGGGFDGKAIIKSPITLRGRPPSNVSFKWTVIWSDTDPEHKEYGYRPKPGDCVVVSANGGTPAGCIQDFKLPDTPTDQGTPK